MVIYSHNSRHNRAATLVELVSASAIAFVVLLVGWASVEMTQRETYATMTRVDTSRSVHGVLQAIETNIMRAQTIQVPDPDYTNVPSIQVQIPLDTGMVRRAYRLEDGFLVVDFKDEANEAFIAFEGVGELEFDVLDAPTNSLIEIVCTVTIREQTITMRTVAKKRN
jgi:hypothetical protein